MTSGEPEAPSKRRVNWWKVGFFVALLAFEVAREAAVVAAVENPRTYAKAWVFQSGGYTTATGRWKRIDGGEPLVPATVTIECRESARQCIEASVALNDNYIGAPAIDLFPATFRPEAVTYENDFPQCAKYTVRIDLGLKKVFAVRERKLSPTNPNCKDLEQRIEMQLADGYDPDEKPLDGHFLPLFQILFVIINLT